MVASIARILCVFAGTEKPLAVAAEAQWIFCVFLFTNAEGIASPYNGVRCSAQAIQSPVLPKNCCNVSYSID